ncbi:MAG TPA: FIST C-terminal domain-containing protein [Bacteroidales bacterium]|mgnify:CR=1 FL=1|nr:FIST C-terminal domain-containing protein [Bacteroidales bacterium]HRX97541.1 FIST C-terminal domain-containing protein [Bacteroidales bacterium]
MKAENIRLIEELSVDALSKNIDLLIGETKPEGLIILACDENQYNLEQTNELLRNLSVPVFGGTFPGIIFGGKEYTKGTIIMGLEEKPQVHIIKNLSNLDKDEYPSSFQNFEQEANCKTVFVFVDGFSQNNSKLIEMLFISFGLEYNFIGAGCGSLSMNPTPCIMTNEGLLSDAAVIAGSKLNGAIGMKHGWQSIAGPIRVTGSEKNTLISLDFNPAYEVYKKIIEEHSGKKVNRENFTQLAPLYPVGITKLGTDKIIRDPVKIDEQGNIVFLGDIPEGTFIHIMATTPDDLINAAKEAMETGTNCKSKKSEDRFILFIDCISRLFLLEERFREELAVINPEGLPVAGTLSLGEIANNKKEYLELYNMTAVVGCFQ